MKYSFTIYISTVHDLPYHNAKTVVFSRWMMKLLHLSRRPYPAADLPSSGSSFRRLMPCSHRDIFLDGSGIVMSSARRLGQSPMMTIDYKDYYCFGSNYPTARRSAFNSAAVEFHPTFLFVVIIIVCA